MIVNFECLIQGVSNVIQVVKDLKQGSKSTSDSKFRFVLISSCLVSPRNTFHPARIALNLIRWRLMDKKFAGEEALRKSGIPYTIVRPGGLKNTPRGKERLVVGQGDCQTMTGISRADVAAVCVACLSSPAALASTKNTTFELTTAPAGSHGRVEGLEDQLSQLLSGLEPDS